MFSIVKNGFNNQFFSFLALVLCLFLLPKPVFSEDGKPAELDIEEIRRRISREAPNEIMSVSLGDTDVSLFLTGSWKGELQFNPGFFISPLGTGYASSDIPLFMQEVDLTLALWITDRWFVEANFLDDSSQNTYRAGYQGKGFIQYAGIGNTGLDFPSFPYMDLGGDSPASFGFYSRFGGNAFNVHALVRYDSSSREERTFSGSRERTYSYIQPQNSARGISFVLPDTEIDSQITVYIEDDKGAIRDSSGRRWRIALSSEYAASRAMGILELNLNSLNGMIAVAYTKNSSATPWDTSLGSYAGLNDGFLSEVQDWFDISRENIKLWLYPQCTKTIAIDGKSALVIYESGTFSPFERRNRYDAPSSTSEHAALVRQSSGAEIKDFELVPYDIIAQIDVLNFYAQSQRTSYELLMSGSFSRRDPQTIWPLAKEFPEIYLPPFGIFSGDAVLRFTNFNSTSGYFIGTDVVPGSVQVWRSGIQDTNFSFNSSSGEVSIYGSVAHNEIIRISYLKRSEETRLGSIAAGIGAIFNNKGPFSAQAAIGVRMNVSDDSFSDEEQTGVGTVGISAKAAWDYNNLKAHITAGLAFEQIDATGLYRIAGMEGNQSVMPLPSDTSFISNQFYLISDTPVLLAQSSRADLVYRNYYENTVLGSNLMPIDWNPQIILGITRPYPARDPQLGDSQVLVAEFSLNGDENWTGFQVPLNYYSHIISRAGELEIPFRFYGFNQNLADNIKLIVQIGSLSSKDFTVLENFDLIWENVLFQGNTIDNNARIAKFTFNDRDRIKLGDAKYLRLIIVYEGSDEITGRVLLAEPIIRGSSFRAVTEFNNTITVNTENVTAIETIDTGSTLEMAYPDITRRLHSQNDTQRILKIEWKNMTPGISAGVDSYISSFVLSDYNELTFFVKMRDGDFGKKNETLSFIVASSSDSINNSQLKVSLPASSLRIEQWSKVTVRYQGGDTGVYVDDINIQDADFNYNPQRLSFDNNERRTSYIAVLVNPYDFFETLDDGVIFIDEIILQDAVMFYRVNAGASLSYSRPGAILSAGRFTILSDFTVFSAFESELRAGIQADDESKLYGSMLNRTGIGVSLMGVKILANLYSTIAENTFLWSADHSISGTYKAFSIKETFSASPNELTARHTLNMAFNSAFYARFEADAFYDLSKLRQNWILGIGFIPKNVFIPSIAFNTQAVWVKNEQISENDNYASLWLRSWEPLIPDSGIGADSRRLKSQIVITQRTKPVGALLTLEGSAFFSVINSITQSDNSAFLDIPLVFEKVNFNFRAGRSLKRHINFAGYDVFDDIGIFFGDIDDLLLYSSLNDHFSFRINFTSLYNLTSIFIPSRITFRVDRIQEQKFDTQSDNLNFGLTLGFSSINMFGTFGFYPVFKFFQNDEYSHSIDAAVIIPLNFETPAWRVQSVLSANFRGHTGGVLGFVNKFSIRNDTNSSDLNWMESFTASWETPTKRSLLSVFYNWITTLVDRQNSWLFLSSLFNSNYEQLRRESLELVFDKTTDHLRWSITAGHEEIVRILGRMNLSAFIKLRLSEDLYTNIFTLNFLIGTSLRITF